MPVQGGRLGEQGVEQGFIPEWLFLFCYARMTKIMHSRGITAGLPTVEAVKRAGGFTPLAMLDLIAGGNGDGLAFMHAHAFDRHTLDQRLGLAVEVVSVNQPDPDRKIISVVPGKIG